MTKVQGAYYKVPVGGSLSRDILNGRQSKKEIYVTPKAGRPNILDCLGLFLMPGANEAAREFSNWSVCIDISCNTCKKIQWSRFTWVIVKCGRMFPCSGGLCAVCKCNNVVFLKLMSTYETGNVCSLEGSVPSQVDIDKWCLNGTSRSLIVESAI